MNANCYGEKASSAEFAKHITCLVTKLKAKLDIDSVTTTSPFVAEVIKREFGDSISIRSSVNMKIGSVKAMEQLSEFDPDEYGKPLSETYLPGYYLQKSAFYTKKESDETEDENYEV